MDNFIINCQSQGEDNMLRLLEVAFSNHNGKASHFREMTLKNSDTFPSESIESRDGVPTFVFMWSSGESKKSNKLPVKMDPAVATKTVMAWLETISKKDWGQQISFDGSKGNAFRVFCDTWDHVANERYAIVAVQPIFAWYGK